MPAASLIRRVLLPLALFLISVGLTGIAPAAHAVPGTAGTMIKGPTYRYILKADQAPTVCKHMLNVFNDRFAHLWDSPALIPGNDTAYSADSKYAFPLLPGVKHGAKTTFDMRHSAWPTSPEFSAIHWEEASAILGGCSVSDCPWDYKPFPIIVAHFDFDNDGHTDTVIKQQFFEGYRLKHKSQEHLLVWLGQNLQLRDTVNLSSLMKPTVQARTPIWAHGLYLRPFIYMDRTYAAEYVYADPGDSDSGQPNVAPWFTPPKTQDMLVQQYSLTGRKQKVTELPEWTVITVCDFAMKQLDE